MRSYIFFIPFLLLWGCSSNIEQLQKTEIKQRNERKDRIHRLAHEVQYPEPQLAACPRDPYPWEVGYAGVHPAITMESFRCKGKIENPVKVRASQNMHDCGGIHKHSLPVRGGKEYIYPILLDLLNYIQVKMGSQVVITCGHRCPLHHAYADLSAYYANSKHMIGAEVDFYVVGFEKKPQAVIDVIMAYYKEKEAYRKNPEYEKFLRLDSVKLDLATAPWYNKEILIKLYQQHEGRDFDNNHPHPYIALQVRFDRERNEKVLYSSEKAFHGYKRYE
jgi:hypothetical protein